MHPLITDIDTAKIQISLRMNAARTTTTIHYDCSLLNNGDIRDKYSLTLRNNFDALLELLETPTVNEENENFVNAHLEAATKQSAKLSTIGNITSLKKNGKT